MALLGLLDAEEGEHTLGQLPASSAGAGASSMVRKGWGVGGELGKCARRANARWDSCQPAPPVPARPAR
eukprot:5647-Chlamydomonas_euryale.AAC.2